MNVAATIGPAYSRRQVLEAGLPAPQLISLPLADGRQVYPTVQFDVIDGGLEPRVDILRLWASLDGFGCGPLGRWMWVTGPKAALDGFTPLEYVTRRGLDERLAGAIHARAARAAAA